MTGVLFFFFYFFSKAGKESGAHVCVRIYVKKKKKIKNKFLSAQRIRARYARCIIVYYCSQIVNRARVCRRHFVG